LLAENAIEEAARKRADILCFPECCIPGYRTPSREMAPPDDAFLQQACSRIAAVAGRRNIAVILGTERFDGEDLRISARQARSNGPPRVTLPIGLNVKYLTLKSFGFSLKEF
jgi:predicted amidohydrolase